MSPKTLKEQINASKHRLQIHEEDWKFVFVEYLPKDLHQRLSKEDYYEKKKFSSKELKEKIQAQKLIFKKRKVEGASFIEEDLNYIHKESKSGELKEDKSKEENKISNHELTVLDEEERPEKNSY